MVLSKTSYFLKLYRLFSRQHICFRLLSSENKYLLLTLKYLVKYPLKVLSKTIKFFITEFYEYKNPLNKRYENLIKTYKLCGLSKERNFYIKTLNKILDELGYPEYNELKGMYSEHLIIFTAIALKNKDIKNILEIGTYDGRTSTILSKLFPGSKIITIDLTDDDPIFINTYGRNNHYELFVRNRNNLIAKYKNIQFIQINSLELSLMKTDLPKQDLIWVDGSHGYPVVASDITNAIGLMNKKSILMCDDIWKKSTNSDPIYKSNAGFETLYSFSRAKIIDTYYFRKRIGKPFNGNYKYVSFSNLAVNKKLK